MTDTSRQSARAGHYRFDSTQWSLVLSAAQGSSPEADQALSILCSVYWPPLYAYIRRKGYAVPEAQDLTQAFFVRLMEKNYLQDVQRGRGKFRSFLLASLKHFLANEWDRAQTQKRGGGISIVPLEMESAEEQYIAERTDYLTPEKIYERRWALTLIDRVFRQLEKEFEVSGRTPIFAQLKTFITESENRIPHRQIAAELGMTEGAVKVAVHRLRRRYRDLMRAEVGRTIASPANSDEVDDELRYLLSALSQ
jgi:RNA polymerase sigma-70 factor (ECF subfamily)